MKKFLHFTQEQVMNFLQISKYVLMHQFTGSSNRGGDQGSLLHHDDDDGAVGANMLNFLLKNLIKIFTNLK